MPAHLSQSSRETFDGQRLLSLDSSRRFVHFAAHEHLGASTTKCDPGLLDGLRQDGERIVQGTVGFVNHLSRGTSKDHCAGFTCSDTGEFDELS